MKKLIIACLEYSTMGDEVPEFKPLFIGSDANPLFGIVGEFANKNERVRCYGNIVDLAVNCRNPVTDETGKSRGCKGQTHGIYTLSLTNPNERRCPTHFGENRPDTFYKYMSESFNIMCDYMHASLDQRQNHLKLQHINHYLGDRWDDREKLLDDEFLRGVVSTNCSKKCNDQIYRRSRADLRVTIDGFEEEDEDPGSDFDLDSDRNEDGNEELEDAESNDEDDSEAEDAEDDDEDEDDEEPIPPPRPKRSCGDYRR